MDSIITFINTTGKSFIEFSTSMLIQSSVLIVLLLLMDFLLRKKVRAVFLYCIWMLILVKLVLPTTLSSPTGLGYWYGDKLPGIITQKVSIPEQTVSILQRNELVSETLLSGTGTAALPSAGVSPEFAADDTSAKFTVASSPVKASLSWQGFAFLGWLSVVIAMFLLLIKRIFFVRGLLEQSTNPNNSIVDIFKRCRKQLGVHSSISLKLSPVAASPSVCGLFRPTILIPQNLSNKLRAEDLRSILLHELAHIKRGDLWVSLIQTIQQIAYFYNPLLWVANAIIRKVREQAVDEMVLVAMGEQAEDYPETLLNISRLTFSRSVLSLRLVGVVESKKALNVRIRHMLNRPIPKSAKLGILGLLVVIITGAILLPMAKAGKDKEVAVEDNVSNESQFIATLPNGVTVELFGICEHPSTGKQWWRPDGSKLSQRPFEKLYQRSYAKRELYELALKVGSPENRKLSIISKGGGVFNLYPDKIWGGYVHSEGKKMLNHSIGIAQGPWKTIMEADPMHTQSFGDIAFGRAFESDYELIGAAVGVTATHTVEKEKVDYRIIAVDRKSNIHTSLRTGIGNSLWTQTTVHFKDLQIDEIKEFQFQTRPYQWIEFKNVSLKPNFKTDVQVEVVGERETRVTMQGGEISVLKGESGPDVVVRRKLPPEGTAYYKKFDKEYLLEIVSKFYGQNITETAGRKTSGETSGPKFVQKRIGFEIPFAYKEVDRLRKKREFQKQLCENIKKDIKDILRVTASGGGVTDLRHLEYSTDKVVGSINIYFSQTDEDILQLKFTIHEVVAAENITGVLRVPSDRYPTIQSAVEAAKEGDKIVLDPSVAKDDVPKQNMPDVQTEEIKELRTILLPDVDGKGLMLDLASGELVEVPKADTLEDISLAIDKLNKGDLVFDNSSLILVRGTTTRTLPETTEPFNTYKIGQRLPEVFNLKTREGVEWTIEIHSVDKNCCQLRYYPVHPNNYISAIPLTALERKFVEQVLEQVRQVEDKYPNEATHWPHGPKLYHVNSQGQVTIWAYQRLWSRKGNDCAEDEVGWGSSQLVNAMGMYYLPNGTPLQSRWRWRNSVDGMTDIRVKIGRTVGQDERVGIIHRHELPSDYDLNSRDGREKNILFYTLKDEPVSIVVRVDKPMRMGGTSVGNIERDVQHFEEYDQLLLTGPPGYDNVPMLVTVQLPKATATSR